ncbi:MAG: PDDEXK nuclease domain-containing protein [Methylococcales bacterium]|nr:PDDEXK nuclease domain-containing protein [Methylococcales bacterium]
MMQATPANPQLLGDIRQLIESSRSALAATVNNALTQLYWHIGQRIRNDVLNKQRAGYGEQIVLTLAKQLEADYGRGFSAKNLRHMLRFAEVFADPEIVSAVRRQLSWTHIKTLIYIDDPLKRDFYIDLLFYNHRLKRLVAIDLKLGDFKAADKGQMELYLRWLAKHEQEPGEASPPGIILCSGKKQEQIELLDNRSADHNDGVA